MNTCIYAAMITFHYPDLKNIIRHVAALTFVAGMLPAASAATDADVSNRTSLALRAGIESWENGTAGYSSPAEGATLTTTEAVPGWSTLVYDGRKCLSVKFPKGQPANLYRSVAKDYPQGLDLGGRTLIEYGIWAMEGPGKDFFTRLTLTDRNGRTFDCEAYFIPSLWRGIVFDVSQCRFLNDIRRVEIGMWCDSPEPWQHSEMMIDGLCAGYPVDFGFDTPGSESAFTAGGKGKIGRKNGALNFSFKKGSWLQFRADTSNNNLYNPPLELRNTVRVVVQNRSKATALRLSYITEHDTVFDQTKSKISVIEPGQGMQAVQFNLSDNPTAKGHLKGFRLEPIGGSGTIAIDRISFEREKPIEANAGRIISCKADKRHLTVCGEIKPEYNRAGARVQLRHAPLYSSELPADSLDLLGECAATSRFVISGVANSRLNGRMTHLSSRLAAFVKQPDGSLVKLGEPFFIENWKKFTTNPYAFSNPDNRFAAEDFGARADGVTNDNAAIQRAIDAAAQAGGGVVVLSAGNNGKEREYLATNLLLGANVTLLIEPGAVLRQSPVLSHYAYRPDYGHDNIIPGIPWTHSMYTNMPLILAKDTHNIKITGGGKIRMDDTYSENRSWTHYAKNCSDRIHIVPIAVCNTRHAEISDIDIVRCSNYHTIFYRADSVYIGNLKLIEVACLSGDGVSLGNAVTNVRIDRLVFESNDDGIVLASSYKDPRGGNWRERVDTIDSSVRNITVEHSYIDSKRGGGGKAIAFIPWGSTNPRQDYNEIDNIAVHDCVLRGGHSVGTWPDNPFDGKVFTGDERDDYAPVKNVNITGNEYLSPCDLMWVLPTTFVNDCGIKSSPQLKNADFADRTAYWTTSGNVTADNKGSVTLSNGSISQGLSLEAGTYRIAIEADGKVEPMASVDGAADNLCRADGTFTLDSDGLCRIGASADTAATIKKIILEHKPTTTTK